jgi:hypothetical protein
MHLVTHYSVNPQQRGRRGIPKWPGELALIPHCRWPQSSRGMLARKLCDHMTLLFLFWHAMDSLGSCCVVDDRHDSCESTYILEAQRRVPPPEIRARVGRHPTQSHPSERFRVATQAHAAALLSTQVAARASAFECQRRRMARTGRQTRAIVLLSVIGWLVD